MLVWVRLSCRFDSGFETKQFIDCGVRGLVYDDSDVCECRLLMKGFLIGFCA